ncbi:MAG: hypothetical protein KatS3mg111_0526 [Pirellulaceae bacterium]|nr:MAG: hypothetical protein KatS3mg111_0526 [Pirellulaceae bacterium]
MRLIGRLFVAFCISTVLAQVAIVAMLAAKGNLRRDTVLKGLALLNGIDVSAERLQAMLEKYRTTPVPKYEDIVQARAMQAVNLQMREEAIERNLAEVNAKLEELQQRETALNQRVEEFYAMLDQQKQTLIDESLLEVQRTIEALAPDLAKEQLMMLAKQGQIHDVVALFKGMAIDKRRKIMGEFVGPEESEQLNEILRLMLEGEPTASLLEETQAAVQK